MQIRFVAEGTSLDNESLSAIFGGGTQPNAKGVGYPPYNELLTQLKAAHANNMLWLESLTEDDLDKPSKHVPPGFEGIFGTWRQVLAMRPLHWMNHRGQLADCRRAAGRLPIMA